MFTLGNVIQILGCIRTKIKIQIKQNYTKHENLFIHKIQRQQIQVLIKYNIKEMS